MSSVTGVVTKERRQFVDDSEKISLPVPFLRTLFEHGHEVLWINYGQDGFLNAVMNHLALYGSYMSIEELKGLLINYEKENAVDLERSLLFRAGKHGGTMSFIEYVEKLENNERIAEELDFDCMSKILGAEISVFFPDFENDAELLRLKKYNSQGAEERLLRIAVVHDNSKFPVRTYATVPVLKECSSHNPYPSCNAGEEKAGG